MELSKEQIGQIESEAEIDVDKAPADYWNREAYTWKAGYELGYRTAATKYLLQSIEDKEKLKHDVKVAVQAMVKLSEVCDKKDARIKELEDGLKTFLEWLQINRPNIAGAFAPIYILKQLLSTNK